MPRDPKRIDETVEVLRAYWKAHPDYRLGQIVANATREITGAVNCDPFYIEDEEMTLALKHMQKVDDTLRENALVKAERMEGCQRG